MGIWRAFLFRQPRVAVVIIAVAMFAKALVPQGYMVMPSNGAITVSLCFGQGSQMVALDLGKEADGVRYADGAKGGGDHEDGKNAHPPCAFSGLSMAAALGAAPALLGLAIAYIMALGLLPVVPRAQHAPSRLRPPLRAPPVLG